MTASRIHIFDCDGVLLDSNAMKTRGFESILAKYDEAAVAAFIGYQRSAFGTSRFRLVERFFSDYLKREPNAGEAEQLLAAFGEYCRSEYPRQPITPGAEAYLQALRNRDDTLYVASGSAEAELRDVLSVIGISKYFEQIFGSPRTKIDIISEVRGKHPGSEMCFYGDAKADFEAAHAHSLPFIYISGFTADPVGMELLKSEQGFIESPSLSGLDVSEWPPRLRAAN